MITVEVKKISIASGDPLQLSQQLTHAMYNDVMKTFEEEGPGWAPLRPRTKKQRLRQGFGEGPILDRKRGRLGLKGGIIEAPSKTEAVVGVRAGIPYAAIHQFGGNINRISNPGKVRLRTTKSGKLVRQENYKNLAVFGKKSHKLVREVEYKGGKAFTISIPARSYLKFTQRLLDRIEEIFKKFVEKE